MPDLIAYWSMDDRLRVDGIAKIMPNIVTKKQYLHLADNAKASARREPNYYPFYKVAPIVNMLLHTFHCRYKTRMASCNSVPLIILCVMVGNR